MILDYYEFVYNVIKELAYVYSNTFPDDESGNLLMDITDQFIYDFDSTLVYGAPVIDRVGIVYTLAHIHINPYSVSINILGIDESYYSTSSQHDNAITQYNQLNTLYEVVPKSAPFFIPKNATNASIALKTGGTVDTVFTYNYFVTNGTTGVITAKQADRKIKIGQYPTSHKYTYADGELTLYPVPRSNVTFITNNKTYYDSYNNALGTETTQSSFNGLSVTHSDSGFYVYTDGQHSINDYISLFNTVLQDRNSDTPLLPSYPEMKHESEGGEYYIGQIHSFDSELAFPSVTLETPDFSLLGDLTTYTFNVFSELGLIVPIVFSLIVGVIAINLKR